MSEYRRLDSGYIVPPNSALNNIDNFIDDISEELKDALKNKFFKGADINNFSDFNLVDNRPTFGEYSFKIEQKFLKDATKALKVVSGLAHETKVKFTIFKDRLKLSLFVRDIFSEVVIPLSEPSDDQQSFNAGGISFVFNLSVLYKIAYEFEDSILEFNFDAEKLLIKLKSGNTKLELSALDDSIVNYHSKMTTFKFISRIDIVRFRDALKYISYFTHKNNVQNMLSIASYQRGSLTGGSFTSVGIYTYDVCRGLDLHIRYECLEILYRILPYFNIKNTHLFETDKFYILRDENLYFGFEKAQCKFPSVDKFLNSKLEEDNFHISRRDLLRGLRKLAIVTQDGKGSLKLGVSGLGETQLELSIKSISGRQSKDILNIFRKSVKYSDSESNIYKEFIVDFEMFMRLINHFTSDEVILKYTEGKFLVITDRGDNFNAKSYLTLY